MDGELAGRFVDVAVAGASGRRVPLADLWAAFGQVDRVGSQAVDARARLADLVGCGVRSGAWSTSTGVDASSSPPLPRFVTLPAARSSPARAHVDVALRPELAWAADLKLTVRQRGMVAAVNRWLAAVDGVDVPVVPSAERSVQLFDDEKVIDDRGGGATLWRPGRFDGQLLAFERSAPLFVSERVGRARRLLLVENQATFLSAVRVLTTSPDSRYGAVGWGEGGSILTRFPSVELLDVDEVDYFGDVDAAGLNYGRKLTALADEGGLPPVRPAVELYGLLVDRGDGPGEMVPAPQAWALAAWLGRDDLCRWAASLLSSGRRAAQERAGFEVLRVETSWCS